MRWLMGRVGIGAGWVADRRYVDSFGDVEMRKDVRWAEWVWVGMVPFFRSFCSVHVVFLSSGTVDFRWRRD